MPAGPARALRAVCCGVLFVALVVGACSLGSVQPALAAGDSMSGERTPSVETDASATDRLSGERSLRRAQPNGTAEPMLEGFDRVETTFDLSENGSASVTVVYRYILEGNDSSAEWEQLKADIERRPEAYVSAERDRWNATLAVAQNATERNMSVDGFSIRTDQGMTPREYGEVIVSFRWQAFATVEPKWIGAGDALRAYSLDEGSTLRISWPAGYEIQSVTPDPDDADRENMVAWRGEETDFLEDEPWIEVLEGGNSSGQAPDDDSRGLVIPFLVGGLVALWLGVGAAWWFRRRDAADPQRPAPEPAPSSVSQPPPELLSNEERVLTLLEDNGGRMKQQSVVSELDWTEAKTSQVVGELRDRGDVEVFRLGRENVLALPDSADDAGDLQ